MMKALLVTASLGFLLFSGFLKGEQNSAPDGRAEEIVQLKKQIGILEERIERLEECLDRLSRPRIVPLICVGVSTKLQ